MKEADMELQTDLDLQEFNNRIETFIENAQIKVLKLFDNYKIGLAYGESKRLKQAGFKRKEQIEILNYLEANPDVLNDALKEDVIRKWTKQ